MVSEIPPYLRLVGGRAVETKRRGVPVRQTASGSADGEAHSLGVAEVVTLVGRENLVAAASQIPTPMEARAALARLQKDLPSLGQGVGDIHSKLNRGRILDLLAPLVEN